MDVIVGGIYRHFKGNSYRVLMIAKDSENLDRELVIYEALYGNHQIWAREYTMFTSKVDKEKYPDIKEEYRFTYIGK